MLSTSAGNVKRSNPRIFTWPAVRPFLSSMRNSMHNQLPFLRSSGGMFPVKLPSVSSALKLVSTVKSSGNEQRLLIWHSKCVSLVSVQISSGRNTILFLFILSLVKLVKNRTSLGRNSMLLFEIDISTAFDKCRISMGKRRYDAPSKMTRFSCSALCRHCRKAMVAALPLLVISLDGDARSGLRSSMMRSSAVQFASVVGSDRRRFDSRSSSTRFVRQLTVGWMVMRKLPAKLSLWRCSYLHKSSGHE
mmetsp:Transcript_26319/g.42238  ORF Transcript_26319/g.42238 Transcript_26319/m.42238 type:complete len:248 (+) Transcript_26319:2470-3213(+)